MDSMGTELKLLARWEISRKKLLAKQKVEKDRHDKIWGDALAGYEKEIKGNPELEALLKF
jgi:hypothetical protein